MSLKSAEIGFASRRLGGVGKQLLLQCRIDEAVGDDFAIAAIGHRRQQAIVRHARLGGFARDLRRDGMTLRDAVEAAQTRDLFDQILLDADVEAMRRLMHAPARGRRLDAIAHRRQHRVHLVVRARSRRAISPGGCGASSPNPVRLGSAAGRSAGHLHRPGLAPDYLQSSAVARSMASAGSVGSTPRSNRCAASVKSPKPPRAPRNRIRREVRRLQQHIAWSPRKSPCAGRP